MYDEYKTEDYYYRSVDNNGDLKSHSSEFKESVRQLRASQTESEKTLWGLLRNKQVGGYKFYRQFPIDGYVLDFFCRGAKLGIELDGAIHDREDVVERDKARQVHLEKIGIRILRFSNNQVLTIPKEVITIILTSLNQN